MRRLTFDPGRRRASSCMHAVSVNGALGKIELRTAQAGPEFVQIMAVISDYVTQIVYRNTVGILSSIPLPAHASAATISSRPRAAACCRLE